MVQSFKIAINVFFQKKSLKKQRFSVNFV